MAKLAMQTCIVNLAELDPPRNGGASRIAHLVSKILAEHFKAGRLNVYFVVGWRSIAQFEGWLGVAGLQVIPFLSGDSHTSGLFDHLHPDLIVSPLFGLQPFGSKSPYRDVPQVVSIPDSLAPDHPEFFNPDLLAVRERLYRELQLAALVVTISQDSRIRLLRHTQLAPERIVVVPLAGDIFHGQIPPLPAGVSQPYVFYPAAGFAHKRHDLLLRAMNLIWRVRPEVKLVLSGWQPPGHIHALMTEYSCPEQNIVALDYVADSAQMAALYRHAEALMFVSAYEGFGMPVLEAMHFDCPVICAPTTALPEIAGSAAIYVESDDPVAWAGAFLEALPRQRDQLIIRGRQQAKKFSWASTKQQWMQVLLRAGLQLAPERDPSSTFARDPFSAILNELTLWAGQYAVTQEQLEEKEKVIQEAHSALVAQQRDLEEKEQAIHAQQSGLLARDQAIRSQQRDLEAEQRTIQSIRTSYFHWLVNGPTLRHPLLRPAARGLIRLQTGFVTRLRAIFAPRIGVLAQHPARPVLIPKSYSKVPPAIPGHPLPSISVVTPSHNQGEFIRRTIASVLDQGYPALEYVVQDGNSTDGTLAALEPFRRKLTHFESKPDSGQAQALNLGFQHTTGAIMAFLNSDDVLLPGALLYVADYFTRHPGVDVVYSHRLIIDENDQEIGRWILPPHDDQVILWADYVPQETLFWRRRLWESAGGCMDDSYQFALDWDLLLRFRGAGARFKRVPRFLAAFRMHARQKTSSQLDDSGMREMNRLRKQIHGHDVGWAELSTRIRPYLMRSVLYQKLYRLGLVRY